MGQVGPRLAGLARVIANDRNPGPSRQWRPPPPHIAIVGGGLAGLAAAVGLADRDLRISLFESRPRLGGRASSFQDVKTGAWIDTGQHLAMGCCTNLASFCARLGVEHHFRRHRTIAFLGPDGRRSTLKLGSMPAPFHLIGAVRSMRLLSAGDKLRVAKGLWALRRPIDYLEDRPFVDWLYERGQTVRTIGLFWSPILVSALNEQVDRVGLRMARKVIVEGLLAHKDAGRLDVPDAPLAELFDTPARRFFADHRIEVALLRGVKQIELDDEGAVAGLRLRTGEFVPADFVTLAVPWDRAADLLDPSAQHRFGDLGRDLQSAPIVGVHLEYDRPVWPHGTVATPGRLMHWVFADEAGQKLRVVISAARDLCGWDHAAIRNMVRAELAALAPDLARIEPTVQRVVIEHKATFVPSAGSEASRPPQRTPIDGLYLAGDWTATGWPATMESAVRSGFRAAEGILADLGRYSRLTQPDLDPDWPARALFRPGGR